jgi:hypothetical protein
MKKNNKKKLWNHNNTCRKKNMKNRKNKKKLEINQKNLARTQRL